MANTFDAIATVRISATTAQFTFAAIPATYTDLLIKYTARSTNGVIDQLSLQYNADSSSSYSWQYFQALNTTSVTAGRYAASAIQVPEGLTGTSATAGMYAIGEIYIARYSDQTVFKQAIHSYSCENNSSTANQFSMTEGASLWRSTNAISTISVFTGTGFAAGSSFHLYGIKKT